MNVSKAIGGCSGARVSGGVGLGPGLRLLAALVGLVPLALLAIVFFLQPDESGLGTHQQLGLPRCSMIAIFGFRCPACGMTTSWAHLVQGDPLASLRSNSGGFLLALASVCFSVAAFFVAIRGRGPSLAGQWALAGAMAIIASVTLVDWVLRLSFSS